MVGAIISVKIFLSLDKVYTGLPPVASLDKETIEIYLSSWMSANQSGVLT